MDPRLAALAEASARIFGAHSLDEALRRIADAARGLVGAQHCVVGLAQGGGEAPPTAETRAMDAAAADSAAHRPGAERRPTRGSLTAPLVASDGSRLGVAQLWDKGAGEFDADDEAMLVQIARLGALAIENFRRLEALDGAARRFHEFAEVGSEVLWETGPDHRYTLFLAKGSFRMNSAPQSYLGKTRWEAAGADPDSPLWAAHIADLEAHRPIDNFEYPVTTLRDGAVHYLRVNANPIFDPSGRFLGYGGATSNVTDLKRAEAAAWTSEERFRQFASIASDWLWETDAEHRFVFFGGARGTLDERPYGKTRWEVAGADLADPHWRAHLADLEARRTFRDFEYTRREPNGRVRFISVSGRPAFDAGGAFCDYRGTATDITAQRKAEAEARKAAEQYRNIVETTNEGVWLVDAEVKTTFVNRRMAEMLGYAPEEIIGRTVSEFRPPEDRVQRESRWSERKRGVAEQREARFVRRDGTVF